MQGRFSTHLRDFGYTMLGTTIAMATFAVTQAEGPVTEISIPVIVATFVGSMGIIVGSMLLKEKERTRGEDDEADG